MNHHIDDRDLLPAKSVYLLRAGMTWKMMLEVGSQQRNAA